MRHAKTDWNAERKLQGRTNIPLNDEGRKMAAEAAKECAQVHFDVCYSSPLSRAQETAKILLAGRDVPIVTDERLIEMGFGIYEGSSDLYQTPDCPINVLFQAPDQYVTSVGGAETFAELYARTGEFLAEVVQSQLQQGKDILIMGHGAMNASIVCQVKGLPLREFWSCCMGNCALMQLV
jgi:probable phosphoglycerate mutase